MEHRASEIGVDAARPATASAPPVLGSGRPGRPRFQIEGDDEAVRTTEPFDRQKG